jgi:HEAT repeat protein
MKAAIVFLLLIACYVLYRMVLRAVLLALLSATGPWSIPWLVDALDDRGEVTRSVVVSELAKHGPEAVPALLEVLRKRDSSRQEGAVIALDIATRHNEAVRVLLKVEGLATLREALKDENPRVRVWAAATLWHTDREANDVVPCLLELCLHGSIEVRTHAHELLRDIGPQARTAVPGLVQALGRSKGRDWSDIAETIRSIDSEVVIGDE